MSATPVLFTPGPVRVPDIVAQYMAAPPCNYHRQPGFRDMFARSEADLKQLIGIRTPEDYFVTMMTATGTGANEACLLALAALGPGVIVSNGFFGDRLLDQAKANAIDHVALTLPNDQPIDCDRVLEFLQQCPTLQWCFFVSHETRTGLKNPMTEIGQACKQRGLVVAADMISSAYAYEVDIEEAQLDLAVASSAKALMAAPGIGFVFVRNDTAPRLKTSKSRAYYLDIVDEYERQRSSFEPRFAQPVALHASVRAACIHLTKVGIGDHLARIQRQMAALIAHLDGLGVTPLLRAEYRSNIAVNFRLPERMKYPEFSSQMQERGYFLLYGIPGDHSHFQVSTIGDLTDEHIAGVKRAFEDVFAP